MTVSKCTEESSDPSACSRSHMPTLWMAKLMGNSAGLARGSPVHWLRSAHYLRIPKGPGRALKKADAICGSQSCRRDFGSVADSEDSRVHATLGTRT
jgi:hypothetical protein